MSVIPEVLAEILLPVERTLHVNFVHDRHDFSVFFGGSGLACGEPVSVESE
jgi:hypothetical protein